VRDPHAPTRKQIVSALRLLDTPITAAMQESVRLAAEICGVPNAMLNIFDDACQHSIATVGFQPPSIPLETATCFPVLHTGQEIIAADARLEPLLAGNPRVDGTLGALRFYATVPLIMDTGEVIGTLCAYDLEVHEVSPTQVSMLRALATQVTGGFELRRAMAQVADVARRLKEQTRLSAEVLDTSMDAYYAARADGTVIAWNRSAEELFGYPAEEAIGRNLKDLVVPERFLGLYQARLPGNSTWVRGVRRMIVHRRDGTEFTADMTIWASHSQPGWHAFVRDVTEIDAARQERAAAEERWRVAFESAPVGMTVNDLSDPERGAVLLSANRQFSEMLGHSLEELRELGTVGVTHPEDIELDLAAARRLMDGSLDIYRRDKRYLHADGHVVWGRLTASLARTGDAVYLISQVEDITAARQAERGRRQAEELLSIAFEHAPHGTAIIGVGRENRGELLRVNPALVTMTGRDDLVGVKLAALLDPNATEVLADFERLADGGQDLAERICRLRAGRGYISAQVSITLARDGFGLPEHALAQLRDVTQQQAHEDWLTRHATTDSLTGLANRLAMRERLLAEIDALRAGEGALAVLMIDLDRFKLVNDTLGHEAGDELLRQVAAALIRAVPAEALAARLGGDEFIVIAPRQDQAGADRLVAQIGSAVNRAGADLEGQIGVPVTGSIGLTTTENPATAPEDLIRMADQAMYQAKRARKELPEVR
jgi:diguanylate cyclase (GGDEF)-like protein/PAS domain S-box-containing protein